MSFPWDLLSDEGLIIPRSLDWPCLIEFVAQIFTNYSIELLHLQMKLLVFCSDSVKELLYFLKTTYSLRLGCCVGLFKWYWSKLLKLSKCYISRVKGSFIANFMRAYFCEGHSIIYLLCLKELIILLGNAGWKCSSNPWTMCCGMWSKEVHIFQQRGKEIPGNASTQATDSTSAADSTSTAEETRKLTLISKLVHICLVLYLLLSLINCLLQVGRGNLGYARTYLWRDRQVKETIGQK